MGAICLSIGVWAEQGGAGLRSEDGDNPRATRLPEPIRLHLKYDMLTILYFSPFG